MILWTRIRNKLNKSEMCYIKKELLDPEIEVTIPSIAMEADGCAVVGGVLLLHGVPTANTVNGEIRLYHSVSLEGLRTTRDFVPFGAVFPVEPTRVEAPVAASRFFQLRVE